MRNREYEVFVKSSGMRISGSENEWRRSILPGVHLVMKLLRRNASNNRAEDASLYQEYNMINDQAVLSGISTMVSMLY